MKNNWQLLENRIVISVFEMFFNAEKINKTVAFV